MNEADEAEITTCRREDCLVLEVNLDVSANEKLPFGIAFLCHPRAKRVSCAESGSEIPSITKREAFSKENWENVLTTAVSYLLRL